MNIGNVIRNSESVLASIDTILINLKNGNGTLGKLLNDEQLYTNLTATSKELEELLRDMKLNPKRFVHFSLFGKKPKEYKTKEEEEKELNN